MTTRTHSVFMGAPASGPCPAPPLSHSQGGAGTNAYASATGVMPLPPPPPGSSKCRRVALQQCAASGMVAGGMRSEPSASRRRVVSQRVDGSQCSVPLLPVASSSFPLPVELWEHVVSPHTTPSNF
jgi:hypothetical protein